MNRIVFAICLLAFGIGADECPSVMCPSSPQSYTPGNVYIYKFDSLYQILTSPDNKSELEETNGKVSGSAKIFSTGDCNFILQLEKVNVISEKDNLRKSLPAQGIPVRFGINANGELVPQICADISDNDYALNLKRSIISLFAMGDRKIETDVFGVCPTETSFSPGKRTTYKNLAKCSHRENFGLIKGIVDDNSNIKSSPLLQGTYNRESEFSESKFLNIVHANEIYNFGGKGKSLVEVKITTTLKFEKSGVESPLKIVNGKPTSLIFDYPKKMDMKNDEILKKQFKKTIENFEDFVKYGSAENFVELLRLMRHATTETLIDLGGSAGEGLPKKIYFDALFRAGTSKSVGAILRQVPKMNEIEKRMAYLSFYLVDDVSKEILNQAASLLTATAPKESYLALGHLVSRFCSKKTSLCEGSALSHVTKKFMESLKKCRVHTKSDEDRIIFALKGIQNSQKIASLISPTILQCSQIGSTRIRIAAIQTFLSASCQPDLQEKALHLLQNVNEDSEVRIESYLASVNCPSTDLALKIEKLVNNEPTNQVGNFISTHLRALQESTDRSKETQKYYLQNIRVTKKFEVDWRRFSFASDNSFLIESLGVGASSEANIIYGLDGYLPRSIRWNVSAEIFGNEFNTWELSMRQENLESILENMIQSTENNRIKRGLKEESEKFSKKYKQRNSNLSFDVSLKLFGSEMFFLSLDNFESFDPKNMIMGHIKKNKFEAHSMFLDAKVLYPTGLGFPLELSAHGMSANKILFDFKNKENAWFLQLIPSFDVSVSAALSVDFQVFKKGVKVSSVIHSATGVNAELVIDSGTINNFNSAMESVSSVLGNWTQKIVKRSTDSLPIEKFSLTLDIPRSSLDIIQIKHLTHFILSEPDKEEKKTLLAQKKKRHTQDQCFEQLLIFGAKVCYRADFTDFSFADFSLTLDLEKKLTFVGSHIKDGNRQSLVLIYDTPESKEQHTTKITTSFGLVPDAFCRLEVELANINKLLALEIGLKNNNKEVTVYLKHSDDSQVTVYRGGISKSENEYYPLLEVDTNGHKESSIAGYRVSGKVVFNNDLYLLDNVELSTPSEEKININGRLTIGKDKLSADLQLNKKMSIKTLFDLSGDPGYRVGVFVDEKGGEIFVANGEVDVEFKAGENNLKISAKVDKEKFDSHLVWIHKNVKETEITFNAKKTVNIVESTLSLEKSGGKSAGLTFKFEKDRELLGRAFFNRHFIEFKSRLDGNKITAQAKTSSGMEISINGLIGDKFTIIDHLVDVQGKIKLSFEDNESQWRIKTHGNNDKYVTEGAVTRNNIELFSWSGEIQTPTDKPINGKGNLKIKDFTTTSTTFKFNPKNGKGESNAVISLKDIKDKIKLDIKLVNLLPKFEIESTIAIGVEKYIVKSENVVERNKLLSKNHVNWGNRDKQIQLILSGNLRNDELQGDFELILPGRDLSGKFAKKQNKNGGTFDVSLKDGKKNLNFNTKLEKNGKNTKVKFNLVSDNFTSEGYIKKNENTYSYDFACGNLKTSASVNSHEVLVKINDLEIEGKRDKGFASLSIKNNTFYLRSKLNMADDRLNFEQESSFDNLRTLIINIGTSKEKKIVEYIINGKKYGLELLHEDNKIDILLSTPTKSSKISMRGEIQNNKASAKWSIEIDNFLNFSGKHLGSYSFENLKNIHISANIEVKNKMIYQLELASQGEKIMIDIKKENNNIAKGSVNYFIKQEPHKSYIEGQGELLIGEKRTEANFKVMRQVFITTIDGESGVKFSFTGNFDDRTTINFVKFTDKEFHGKFCLCDKKTECANVELESREGKVLAIIDLKTFGVPYEFDLKSNINQELMFDARLIDKNNKDVYKVSSSISSLSQRFLLKFHSKEFFVHADSKIPDNGLLGYFEEKVEFGFDKGEKTKVIWAANLEKNLLRLNWQLIHPQIKTLSILSEVSGNFKELDVNGNISFDLFDNKNKEVLMAFKLEGFNSFQGNITSNGLNINNKITLKNLQTPNKDFLINIENANLQIIMIKVEGNINNLSVKASVLDSNILLITSSSNSGIWKGYANILGKEHSIILENNGKYYKTNMELKGVANSEAIFAPGSKMSVKFSETGGAVYGGTISLEKGHFLETKTEGSSEQLNKILVTAKNDTLKTLKTIENVVIDSTNKIKVNLEKQHQLISDSIPNFSKAQEYYGNQINEISREIEKDFGPISDILPEYKEAATFIIERFKRFYNDLNNSFVDFYSLLSKVFIESVVPAIRSIIHNFEELIETILTSNLTKIESLDLSPYIKLMAPWIETCVDFITNTLKEFNGLCKEYEELVKTWPSLTDLFNKINNSLVDFKLSDHILELLNSSLLQVKSVIPESSLFCDKLYSYIKTKISGEKVDDLLALNELFNILKNSTLFHQDKLLEEVFPDITFGSLPKISFSFLKLIERVPTLHNIRLTGHILPNGGFISFDGKFLVYNKSCRLILAQDSKNGNFTIFGNYKNGQLKVLSIIDKTTTIELFDNGSAKLNGKNVNWPIISSGKVIGSKQWNSFNIRNLASSVEIICSQGLKNCHITISYLYTGQIRGILGNGNGEQFDDSLLPDGNISDSNEKFFTSYGIGTCEVSTPVSNIQNDNCLSLFDWDSPMSLAFRFIPTSGFKKMCEHYSKCEVAFAYASAANLRNIPVFIPNECLKCEDKKEFGDQFSIKIPTNKADVVFVVDLDMSKQVLHDLVVPAISEIQKDLKDRNLVDVNSAIIGYTSKYSEPLIINGNLENLEFHEPITQNFFDKLIFNILPRTDERAFELAMRYPFRPTATKTIVVIRADGLVLNLGNVGRAILYSAAAEVRGILLQVVQPVPGLTDDIIGFNNKLVVPLKGPKDAKKRPLLKYSPNVSIGNVLQSGGWVFNLNKFNELSNEDDRKSFVHQFTSAIAENLFRTEITGNCKCLSFDGMTGSTGCLVVKNVNTTKKSKTGGRR
ncbi:hypothetical protein ACFFRR_009699 [Megaselia abdita]